jgi:hypothetical protein
LFRPEKSVSYKAAGAAISRGVATSAPPDFAVIRVIGQLHARYVDTGPWSIDIDHSGDLTVPIVALLAAALVLFLRVLERWYQRRHGSSLPPRTDLLTLAGFALLLVAVVAIEAHFFEWAGVWKH